MVDKQSTKINITTMPAARSYGFSLIELLIILVIIGILASIAYPNYKNYQVEVKRTDMMAEIQQMASRIEAQKLIYKKYENIPLSKIYIATPTSGKMSYPVSGTSVYEVSIFDVSGTPTLITSTNLSTKKWKIQAQPLASTIMTGDGTLTIDYTGMKCRGSSCGHGEQWK